MLALALMLVDGCAGREKSNGISLVSSDDPRMNAAIRRARASVRQFEAALRSPRSSQSRFSIKVRIKDGDQAEHFWLSDVTFDGSSFYGRIDNEPEVVTNVKFGEAVAEPPAQISDSMYVDRGTLVGGYTTRAIREAMSPSDGADFDKSVPFKIK